MPLGRAGVDSLSSGDFQVNETHLILLERLTRRARVLPVDIFFAIRIVRHTENSTIVVASFL